MKIYSNMRQYQCEKCHKIFKEEGEKIEEMSPLYGKIWRWQAKHTCSTVCQEYFPPKVKSKKKPKPVCAKNCPTCPYSL